MSSSSRLDRAASGDGDAVYLSSRGERTTMKIEIFHPTRPKILSDFLEGRSHEVKKLLDLDNLAETVSGTSSCIC